MAMIEMNRPLPTTGLKQWSAKLTREQRSLFEDLPTDEPEPVWALLDDVLGPITATVAQPSLERILVAPEGYIRGMYLPHVAPEVQLRHLSEEFLALYLYLTVILRRADWLLGVEGIYSLRRLLHEFFLVENGRPHADDAVAWENRLNPSKQKVILGLPTGKASRDAVIRDYFAIKHVFDEIARRKLGDQYPSDLERTVETSVEKELTEEPD
jgi:hypothetical protein